MLHFIVWGQRRQVNQEAQQSVEKVLRRETRGVCVEIKAETAGDLGEIVEDFQRSSSAERAAFRRYDFFNGLLNSSPRPDSTFPPLRPSLE